MRIYTLGFSHKSAEEFFDILRDSGVRRVVDIRRSNTNQLAGFSKKDDLRYFLQVILDMPYTHELALAPSADLMHAYRHDEVGFDEFSKQLREKHLWAFSVGLSGVPGGNVVDPVRVGPVLLRINPIDETTFAGRLEPRELSLRERSVARLGGAQEGDYRDWDEIRRWSRSVSDMAKTL